MQKKFLGLIAAGGVVFLSGCQTMPYQPYARNVKVEPQSGGVVALKLEHQDEDRAKAQSMMANNCGGQAVKVLEEANDAGSNGTRVGSLFGIPVTSGAKEASKNTATVTTNKKEWQIRYKCIASSESKRVVR
jgi:hypothetical protein